MSAMGQWLLVTNPLTASCPRIEATAGWRPARLITQPLSHTERASDQHACRSGALRRCPVVSNRFRGSERQLVRHPRRGPVPPAAHSLGGDCAGHRLICIEPSLEGGGPVTEGDGSLREAQPGQRLLGGRQRGLPSTARADVPDVGGQSVDDFGGEGRIGHGRTPFQALL